MYSNVRRGSDIAVFVRTGRIPPIRDRFPLHARRPDARIQVVRTNRRIAAAAGPASRIIVS